MTLYILYIHHLIISSSGHSVIKAQGGEGAQRQGLECKDQGETHTKLRLVSLG